MAANERNPRATPQTDQGAQPEGRAGRAAPPQLDDTDRRIIAILQADGRRPYSQMAEELGLPASSVRYRVQRLEETGILQIVGIANPLTIGFDRMAMIGIRVRAGKTQQVCRSLRELPETSYVIMTSGRFDVMAEVICRDTAHFADLVNNRLHLVDGVESTESLLVLEVHKLAYGWGVGEVAAPPFTDAPEPPATAGLDQRGEQPPPARRRRQPRE